ncbi:MAG: ATP-binding protein [Rhodobacteraceae bacterium]|nr:ATP-binding protein [Paracoccaceae bacterium]
MPTEQPCLHVICGKIAAGKSTLAAELGAAPNSVVIAEDDWLAALFKDQMSTGQDYMRCAAKLKTVMGPHVASLLCKGVTVVMDYPANTVDFRRWMREVATAGGAHSIIHVLDVPDDVCLARLKARNAAGAHAFAASEAQFRQFNKYYKPPAAEEGFDEIRMVGSSRT